VTAAVAVTAVTAAAVVVAVAGCIDSASSPLRHGTAIPRLGGAALSLDRPRRAEELLRHVARANRLGVWARCDARPAQIDCDP
jgi:hypothetical protein